VVTQQGTGVSPPGGIDCPHGYENTAAVADPEPTDQVVGE
jgi:hypothetical protein